MSTLITRIGHRDDPKRTLVNLEDRALGSFGGTLTSVVDPNEPVQGVYGNSFKEALRMSFYWAGIQLNWSLKGLSSNG